MTFTVTLDYSLYYTTLPSGSTFYYSLYQVTVYYSLYELTFYYSLYYVTDNLLLTLLRDRQFTTQFTT